MRGRTGPLLGSLAFLLVGPGTAAVWLPLLLTGWRVGAPFLGIPAARLAGIALAAAGAGVVLECFLRFALEGRGTPAPMAPTEALVVRGLYRRVRNPMYVAVLAVVLGEALVLGSLLLLAYAAVLWTVFHVFVVVYEERVLARKYGESYFAYRAAVPRWLPRLRHRRMVHR